MTQYVDQQQKKLLKHVSINFFFPVGQASVAAAKPVDFEKSDVTQEIQRVKS